MGDRICILRAGRIEQVGAPLDVYANPANMFVAQFLASPSMNFLPCRLTSGSSPQFEIAPGLSWTVPAAHAGHWGVATGAPVVLGIRPEDIHAGDAPGRIGFDLVVTAVEALGPETILTGTMAAAPQLAPVRVRLGRAAIPHLGETVRVHADLSQAHLFDAQSEAVIPRPASAVRA